MNRYVRRLRHFAGFDVNLLLTFCAGFVNLFFIFTYFEEPIYLLG